MKLEHVAIWTSQLEALKNFYVDFLGGVANNKYRNTAKNFESYFIAFTSGARLELMSRPDIPDSLNDWQQQFKGIIHLAFEEASMAAVDEKVQQFLAAGFPVLSGPRKTGDGYYEFETIDPDNNRIEITAKWEG